MLRRLQIQRNIHRVRLIAINKYAALLFLFEVPKSYLKPSVLYCKNKSNELLWKMCVHRKYDDNAVCSHVKQKAFQQGISRHRAMITAGVLLLWP